MELHLEKVDPPKNCFRFYHIDIEPDLFAEAALVVRWGRIGRRPRCRIAGLGSKRDAQEMATRILQLRLKHGYRLR